MQYLDLIKHMVSSTKQSLHPKLHLSWFIRFVNNVSKNDTDVAHYNFNTHKLILVIFVAEMLLRVCYQTVICYPTSPN